MAWRLELKDFGLQGEDGFCGGGAGGDKARLGAGMARDGAAGGGLQLGDSRRNLTLQRASEFGSGVAAVHSLQKYIKTYSKHFTCYAL